MQCATTGQQAMDIVVRGMRYLRHRHGLHPGHSRRLGADTAQVSVSSHSHEADTALLDGGLEQGGLHLPRGRIRQTDLRRLHETAGLERSVPRRDSRRPVVMGRRKLSEINPEIRVVWARILRPTFLYAAQAAWADFAK